MPIDFNKPATGDNYATVFVPGIRDNQTALAQLLDSGLVSITGTPPTGAKRYNATTSAMEQWNGSAWVALPFHGINFSTGGHLGVGTSTPNKIGAGRTLTVNGTSDVALELAVGDAARGRLFGNSTRLTLAASGAVPITFESNGVEGMRMDSSRNLVIGGTLAYGKLDVVGAAIHLNNTNADVGAYINVMGESEASFAGGATYNSFSSPDYVYRAKSTVASGVRIGNGEIAFWGNTGLTVGNNFASTVRARISAAGTVFATLFDGSGANLTNLPAAELVGALPALNGAALTSLTAANLTGALPAISGANLTSLPAGNLTGTVANARTTGTTAATANTLALRDANGDTAVRALTLGNAAVAGNVLNWFEKDVAFTPVVQFGGGAATGWSFTIAGRYSRVGNLVFFACTIIVNTVGSASGTVSLTPASFPYAPASIANVTQYAGLNAAFASGLVTGGLRALMGSSNILFENWAAATGTVTLVTNSNMPVNSRWDVSGSYFV